jgi:Putative Actinobacterial Holin-X, holin superfamily III
MAEPLPTTRPDATIGATLLRAFDLAQRVATDEVRLLHLETQDRVHSLLRRGTWVAAGSLCLLLAWLGLSAAAVVVLAPYASLAARLALVAASQALLGAVLMAIGLRNQEELR